MAQLNRSSQIALELTRMAADLPVGVELVDDAPMARGMVLFPTIGDHTVLLAYLRRRLPDQSKYLVYALNIDSFAFDPEKDKKRMLKAAALLLELTGDETPEHLEAMPKI